MTETPSKVLFLLDPSIIKESSTKVALVKKLLEFAYPDSTIDQFNINLLQIKSKTNPNNLFNSFKYCFFLSSQNFDDILHYVSQRLNSLNITVPVEVTQLSSEFESLSVSSIQKSQKPYHISDNVLTLIYQMLIVNGFFYVNNKALNINGIANGFTLDADSRFWIKPDTSRTTVLNRNNNNSTATKSINLQMLSLKKKLDSNAKNEKSKSFDFSYIANDNDEIIDEDELLMEYTSEPMQLLEKYKCLFDEATGTPLKSKKRRRACKDCTCGLRELEEQELQVKLTNQEITEIDFTVEGEKISGCGSCSLGDAFRCDGCPYLGLPAFKPGQPISIDAMGDDF